MPRKRRIPLPVEIVTIPCEHLGCTHQATHYPKLCVPAKGWPVDSHRPLACIIGVRLCKDHVTGFDIHRMLHMEQNSGATLAQIFSASTKKAGMLPPDFARAFMLAVPLNCEEANVFKPKGPYDA